MKINSNPSSALDKSQEAQKNLMQQLATARRINSAADDAAGLQIADRLSSQISGFGQAIRNANDGISYAQVADSALSGVNDAVGRIEELSLQAANGALNDSDRSAIQDEITQLQEQVSDTFSNTTFGGKEIFGGDDVAFQIGADANTVSSANAGDDSVLAAINAIDVTTQAGAQAAISSTKQIREDVNTNRASLGAFENSIKSTINGLGNQEENVAAARSRIEDTDFAKAVTDKIANDIRSDASIAIKAQANRNASSVLGLL